MTLVQDGVAAFPDAVTSRGARHLEELAHVVGLGHRGVLFFHVARGTGGGCPAESFDPTMPRRCVPSSKQVSRCWRTAAMWGLALGLRERLQVRVGG